MIMGSKKRLLLSFFICGCLCLGACRNADPGSDSAISESGSFSEREAAENEEKDLEEQMRAAGDYLYETVSEPAYGSIGGEWTIIGLKRSGYQTGDAYDGAYLQSVYNVLEETEGVLDSNKYTEYSRVILALTALGEDVSDVNGYNLLEPLCDFDSVCIQGINGPIWALIALDSGAYELPKDQEASTPTTRESFISYILDAQLDTGGWSFSSGEADADLTAMAIQALAGYVDDRDDVKTTVEKALEVLSGMQQESGGFASWGEESLESAAQVLVALSAVEIDPEKDPRFIKNGNSVYDALISYANENGSFCHTIEQGENLMATEQAYYAMTAYDRMLNGETFLYDMTDVMRE